jgi:hypothetical protein
MSGGIDPIFGDLRYEREMRENQIKGNMLGRRAPYVRDRWGQPALDALIRAVPPSARKYLTTPPLSFAWYPFGVLMDIDRALIEGPMGGNLDGAYEFGSAIAKHDLPLLYKVLFRVGSPAFIVKRLNIVARQYIRDSVVAVHLEGAGRARVTLGGRRLPYYFCAYGVSGWLDAALEMSGAKNPAVEHPTCLHRGDEACTWRLTWS